MKLFKGKGPSSLILSAEPSEISLYSCILNSIDSNLRTRLDAFDITVFLMLEWSSRLTAFRSILLF